jgi:PPOX class probable F420-dependent enzyme
MTEDEVRAFMRTGSRTGKLATVRADGAPHVAPIWFDFDDAHGDVVFLTHVESVKGHNLARDGRASLVVDLEEMPFAFARVDGEATITPYDDDPEAVRHWATVTCRRYVGDARAEEFGRRNAVPGEALVRLRPTRIYGEQGIAE